MIASARAQLAAANPAPAQAALGWIELADSTGVSVWAMQLSLDAGNIVRVDKSLWFTLTSLLWEVYRSIAVFAIWLIDWVLSFDWLTMLQGPVADIGAAVSDVVDSLGGPLVLLTIAAFLAVIWMVRGRWATGLYDLLFALVVATLSMGALANPVAMVSAPGGWVEDAHELGLELAAGASGSAATVQPDGIADALTAQMVDVFIRQPLQVLNFGEVLTGGCQAAWRQGVADWAGEGPTAASDAPQIRDALESAGCEDQVERANNLGASGVAAVLVMLPAAGILLAFAVVLAGALLVAAARAMYLSVKLVVVLVWAILPGVFRGSLLLTGAQLLMELVTVALSVWFLAIFMYVVTSVLSSADGGAAMATFFIVDVLLVVGLVVFRKGRKAAKQSAARIAAALAVRPGRERVQPSPYAIPGQANERNYARDMAMLWAAGKVAGKVFDGRGSSAGGGRGGTSPGPRPSSGRAPTGGGGSGFTGGAVPVGAPGGPGGGGAPGGAIPGGGPRPGGGGGGGALRTSGRPGGGGGALPAGGGPGSGGGALPAGSQPKALPPGPGGNRGNGSGSGSGSGGSGSSTGGGNGGGKVAKQTKAMTRNLARLAEIAAAAGSGGTSAVVSGAMRARRFAANSAAIARSVRNGTRPQSQMRLDVADQLAAQHGRRPVVIDHDTGAIVQGPADPGPGAGDQGQQAIGQGSVLLDTDPDPEGR